MKGEYIDILPKALKLILRAFSLGQYLGKGWNRLELLAAVVLDWGGFS